MSPGYNTSEFSILPLVRSGGFDFAIQVAEQGLAAVAIESLGFGCRRDGGNKSKGLAQKACEPASGAALLLGQTMIGWRV
jgi:hypothetical protein